jgi:hypothetical protein
MTEFRVEEKVMTIYYPTLGEFKYEKYLAFFLDEEEVSREDYERVFKEELGDIK